MNTFLACKGTLIHCHIVCSQYTSHSTTLTVSGGKLQHTQNFTFYTFSETPYCQDFPKSWLCYTSNITCSPVHTTGRTHTPSQLHRDYGEATAQQPQSGPHTHKMSVGRGRWQWPCHNLSLIIYTARLTVSMQRPEKIQPTNLICTQWQ